MANFNLLPTFILTSGKTAPFFAHLQEVRLRGLLCFLSVLLSYITLLFFWKEVVYFFTTPMASFGRFFLSTHLSEPFLATMKICGAVALFLNYPLFLYHFYSFFSPSLYRREKGRWSRIFYFSLFSLPLALLFTSLFILPSFLQFFFQFQLTSSAAMDTIYLF
jgi:Sec-independent protein secretion pathway component TatC